MFGLQVKQYHSHPCDYLIAAIFLIGRVASGPDRDNFNTLNPESGGGLVLGFPQGRVDVGIVNRTRQYDVSARPIVKGNRCEFEVRKL